MSRNKRRAARSRPAREKQRSYAVRDKRKKKELRRTAVKEAASASPNHLNRVWNGLSFDDRDHWLTQAKRTQREEIRAGQRLVMDHTAAREAAQRLAYADLVAHRDG